MDEFIKNQIKDSIEVKEKIFQDENCIKKISDISEEIIACYKKENKVLICGNGGSAADSQHIAAELVAKFRFARRALPAIALTTNTSIITAISNDYDFDMVFARQVEGYGKKGDILIGISTSGNSNNISKAFIAAQKIGIKTVALLGKNGGLNKNFADMSLIVPSNDTPRIQESHIMIGHIICDIIERTLFGDGKFE